jgi:hypothetical protein
VITNLFIGALIGILAYVVVTFVIAVTVDGFVVARGAVRWFRHRNDPKMLTPIWSPEAIASLRRAVDNSHS